MSSSLRARQQVVFAHTNALVAAFRRHDSNLSVNDAAALRENEENYRTLRPAIRQYASRHADRGTALYEWSESRLGHCETTASMCSGAA